MLFIDYNLKRLLLIFLSIFLVLPSLAKHKRRKYNVEDPRDKNVAADLGEERIEKNAYIRLNQVGYSPSDSKHAVIMATQKITGTYSVLDSSQSTIFTLPVPNKILGKWSVSFPYTYDLNLSQIKKSGDYTLQVKAEGFNVEPARFSLKSPATLYAPLLANALSFFRGARDGHKVIQLPYPLSFPRIASHLNDTSAYLYNTPPLNGDSLAGGLKAIGPQTIDVEGGWFDAGDYLKFVETESYVTGVMLFSIREYPKVLQAQPSLLDESRFGLEWLLKMWDSSSQTLYYQVGIGDGNDSIIGDHGYWRLPEWDDSYPIENDESYYFIKYRPVFVAAPAHSKISPNLAGRMAAALALGYQVFKSSDAAFAAKSLQVAKEIYSMAETENVGKLTTASNYDFYPEVEWRDDLEWGASELALATKDNSYNLEAERWAKEYIHGPNHLKDTLNLYDVSAIAHYELATNDSNFKNDLIDDLKAQIGLRIPHYKKDPFGFGMAYAPSDDPAPHTLGIIATVALYKKLTDDATYDDFAQAQRDWIFGKNAWGSSFVIGAGNVYPLDPHDQISNLTRPDGKTLPRLGAVVDGYSSTIDSTIDDGEIDIFAPFNRKGAKYRDYVKCWETVEPAIDYTVPTVLVYAQQF